MAQCEIRVKGAKLTFWGCSALVDWLTFLDCILLVNISFVCSSDGDLALQVAPLGGKALVSPLHELMQSVTLFWQLLHGESLLNLWLQILKQHLVGWISPTKMVFTTDALIWFIHCLDSFHVWIAVRDKQVDAIYWDDRSFLLTVCSPTWSDVSDCLICCCEPGHTGERRKGDCFLFS